MKKLAFVALLVLFVAGLFVFFTGEVVGLAPKPVSNCNRIAPTIIAYTSANQSAPGTQLVYPIMVTNNNVGPGCGTTQFNLLDINIHGWTTSISTPTFDLCSGSGYCNTTWVYYRVTSPVTATSGTYDFYLVGFETGQMQANVIRVDYII
ncbi:MAG: hypothetical protein AABX95_00940 [Nanoarchaeota archaeon]